MASIVEQIVRIVTDGEETKAEVIGTLTRCKDCKHRQQYDCNNITLGGTKCGVTDDWYCADGERKETEDAEDIPMEYFENGGI